MARDRIKEAIEIRVINLMQLTLLQKQLGRELNDAGRDLGGTNTQL